MTPIEAVHQAETESGSRMGAALSQAFEAGVKRTFKIMGALLAVLVIGAVIGGYYLVRNVQDTAQADSQNAAQEQATADLQERIAGFEQALAQVNAARVENGQEPVTSTVVSGSEDAELIAQLVTGLIDLPQAAPGSPGTAGPTGAAGESGAAGASGSNGTDGQDGQDGTDGAPGTPGTPGAAGSPGATITSVTRGENCELLIGVTGADGETTQYNLGSICGPPGPTGETGVQGPVGPQGEPPAQYTMPGLLGATVTCTRDEGSPDDAPTYACA